MHRLLNLFAPALCVHCRRFGSSDIIVCQECSVLIKPILSTQLVLNASIRMNVYAIGAYEEPLKSLIIAKGWSDIVASKKLGQLMWQYSLLRRLSFDCLVPIPLHQSRYAIRGYNQCEVIAQELSVLSGKPVLNCLERTKRTRYQARVKTHERYKNVENAFVLKDDVQDKRIVLIDDLMTTGSTLAQAGRTLLNGNPQEIHALVACRAL